MVSKEEWEALERTFIAGLNCKEYNVTIKLYGDIPTKDTPIDFHITCNNGDLGGTWENDNNCIEDFDDLEAAITDICTDILQIDSNIPEELRKICDNYWNGSNGLECSDKEETSAKKYICKCIILP